MKTGVKGSFLLSAYLILFGSETTGLPIKCLEEDVVKALLAFFIPAQ